jgi:hypothetical protein
MKTARIYCFLKPAPTRFDDNGESPLAVIPVERTTGAVWEAAILGTPSTIIAIRVTIPDIKDEKIEEEDFRRFLSLRTYLLDCIRIVYDPTAEYFRVGDNVVNTWNFLAPERKPQFAIEIQEPFNPDYRVNTEGLRLIISAVPFMRPFIHLIADGADPRLPIQFRFLSYYKIIEMHYRVTPNSRFTPFVASFLPDFQLIYPEITTTRDLCSSLTKLRNRCAHIKLASGDLGYSHLEARPDDLAKALPIIGRMAIRAINVNHPDTTLRFAETPEQAATEYAEMEAAGMKPVRVSGSGPLPINE